jgi:hypothetical protein
MPYHEIHREYLPTMIPQLEQDGETVVTVTADPTQPTFHVFTTVARMSSQLTTRNGNYAAGTGAAIR